MPITPTASPFTSMGRLMPWRTVAVSACGVMYSSGRWAVMIWCAPWWNIPIRLGSVLAMMRPVSSIRLMFCRTRAPISSTIFCALSRDSCMAAPPLRFSPS